MRNDLPLIKEQLKGRIESLCAKLLPDGRREGRLWVSHNPRVADDARKDPALKVALGGDRGAWRDWRNGDKGDVINLITFVMGCDINEALQWARDFLGLRQMTREEHERMRKAADAQAQRERQRNEKARAFKLVKAQELWRDVPAGLGSGSAAEAHARAYFAARQCALEDVAHLAPDTFRFSGATEWWKGAQWAFENGRRYKAEEGPRFPAIHSALRQATGAITCCHCTFLDPVVPAKAPVKPAKLMFGEALGAVIEISTGPGGVSFWLPDAPAAPLIIAEGIETALSMAKAVPEARVWAAGSLSGFGYAPVHLPCVADVIVARDNNTGNAQAEDLLQAGVARMAKAEKPIVIINSHVGDDFNNLEQ